MRKPKACPPENRLCMPKEMKGFFGRLIFRNEVNLYVLAFGIRKRVEDFTAFDERQVAVDLLLQDEQMLTVPLEMVRDAEMHDARFPVNVCNIYN